MSNNSKEMRRDFIVYPVFLPIDNAHKYTGFDLKVDEEIVMSGDVRAEFSRREAYRSAAGSP